MSMFNKLKSCPMRFKGGGGGGGSPAIVEPPKAPKYAQYGQQGSKTANAIQAQSNGTNSTDVTKGTQDFNIGLGQMEDDSMIMPLGLSGNAKVKKKALLGIS